VPPPNLLGRSRDSGDHPSRLSKVEAGKLELESRLCELEQLAGDVRSLYSRTAQRKGLVLEVELEPTASVLVSDPLRVRRTTADDRSRPTGHPEQGDRLSPAHRTDEVGEQEPQSSCRRSHHTLRPLAGTRASAATSKPWRR
jgi:hypothetical protein